MWLSIKAINMVKKTIQFTGKIFIEWIQEKGNTEFIRYITDLCYFFFQTICNLPLQLYNNSTNIVCHDFAYTYLFYTTIHQICTNSLRNKTL